MLIILEGADCAGKSSLGIKLKDAILSRDPLSSVEVRHSGPPKAHPLEEYEMPLLDYRPGLARHIIYDRFHWGEQVYPSVLGRTTALTDAARIHINMFLRSRGALIIRVHAPRQAVNDCLRQRGDDLVDHTMINHIEWGYDEAQRTSLVPFMEVDGRTDVNRSIEHIIERAANETRNAQRLNPFVTYVGPYNARLLLLGDVRSGTYDATFDQRPAFMPFGNTSGHFLLSAMHRQFTIKELASVGIVNACDVDDANELAKIVQPTRVIALGGQAARVAPWATHRVHHPQYVRRFAHNTINDYGHTLSGFGSSLPRFT